jgi:antitoxin CptB
LTETQLKRARWRSRRGMRELDVILNRFIDACYEDLDAAERDAFDSLLDGSDVDLYAWLTGRTVPGSPKLDQLVALVRQSDPRSLSEW